MHHPLKLRCDASALTENYRALATLSGVATGAAIKANGYGLGAAEVARRLLDIGCRDFFVSTWWEAAELSFLPEGTLSVLHGFGPADKPIAGVRPVLASAEQVARWQAGPWSDQPCDVMVDTGMNRLGLDLSELPILDNLRIHTLHSHLACADEDHPLNEKQLDRFRQLRAAVPAERYSLANSAGILLGRKYSFDLVRPGVGLYGGTPRPEATEHLRQVVTPQAQVVQLRTVRAGETVGYNATYVADREITAAILNIGYADGYWRAFSSCGTARKDGQALPVIGRVSMDLVTIDVSCKPTVREGDWVDLDFNLAEASRLAGYSQYELLTGLGRRFLRFWQ